MSLSQQNTAATLADPEAPGVKGHHGVPRGVRAYDHQPFLPRYERRYANPSPLAFAAMASGLYIVSIIALGTDGLSTLSVVPSIALGFSALSLLVAGIWEFPTGNTYGATVYIAMSGFFASLGLILSGSLNITTGYGTTGELDQAIGQFFFSWLITGLVFTVSAFRSSGGLLIFWVLVDFFLLFLGLAYHNPHTAFLRAAGAFGIIASFVAWYATAASLVTHDSTGFSLPEIVSLHPRRDSVRHRE